jgi:signal transduction histidine kinase
LAVVVALGTQVVTRYYPGIAVTAVVSALLILLTFPVWLVSVGILSATDTETLIRVTVINVNVLAVVMLAGASPAMARNREAVLTALRRRRDKTSVHQLQVESQLLTVAQELAATLHGSSRSTFMAAALRLEAALDHGQTAVALDLVEDLRRTIFAAEDSLHDSRPAATAADLDTVIDNWRSVCAIAVDGSWHEVSPQLMPDLHTVVVEAISDAMRHGDCAHIAITVRPAAWSVDLIVTNDGLPMHAPGRAGLGTALLDRLAPGDWSRGVDADGRTRLTVTLK